MSETHTAERDEIRAMASDLAYRELAPRASALDAGDERALADCWHVLVQTGLDRGLLDEEHGGSGMDALDLLAAVEELAVGDGGMAMQALLCNAALTALGDELLSEVRPGSRWALVPACMDRELTVRDGLLGGHISCALGAHRADGLVILRDGPRQAPCAVPADAPSVKIEREASQMGLRAARAASIAIVGLESERGAGALNGSAADAAPRAMALLRAGTAAIARGIARRCHELALEYAHARRQGGVAIIEHDAVSDMLAGIEVRLARRPALALTRDGGAIDAADALRAKIAAAEDAVASSIDAVQVFGGTGYMVDTGIEKLMRDAKYCQLFPEPNWVAQSELMEARPGRGEGPGQAPRGG